MLVHLFMDNALRATIRSIVHDAFGLYLTLDQLSPDSVRIRMSSVPPDEHEQHFDEAARKLRETGDVAVACACAVSAR